MSGVQTPNLAGVIAKPFDPMTLAAEIAALLGWADCDDVNVDDAGTDDAAEDGCAAVLSSPSAAHARPRTWPAPTELGDALAEVAAGALDESSRREAAVRSAHQLAGSAGTFGFAGVSSWPVELERLLRRGRTLSGLEPAQLASRARPGPTGCSDELDVGPALPARRATAEPDRLTAGAPPVQQPGGQDAADGAAEVGLPGHPGWPGSTPQISPP